MTSTTPLTTDLSPTSLTVNNSDLVNIQLYLNSIEAYCALEANNTESDMAKAQVAMDAAFQALPEFIQKLSRELLQDLALLANWFGQGNPSSDWLLGIGKPQLPFSKCMRAAIIRGDIPYGPCPPDENGIRVDARGRDVANFKHATHGLEVEVILEQHRDQYHCEGVRVYNWFLVDDIRNYDPSHVHNLIEPRFRAADHSLATLQHWPSCVVPKDIQLEHVERVKNLPDDLDCWMILGGRDGNTRKTTLVSAYLKDVITHRQTYKVEGLDIGIWSIQTGRWLEEIAAWNRRDYKDPNIKPPRVSVETIQRVCESIEWTKWRPILWLEEADKWVANSNRRAWLFNLVDAVSRNNGMIITTSNETKEKLYELFGGPLFGRLSGERNPAKAEIWDLHSYNKDARKRRARSL